MILSQLEIVQFFGGYGPVWIFLAVILAGIGWVIKVLITNGVSWGNILVGAFKAYLENQALQSARQNDLLEQQGRTLETQEKTLEVMARHQESQAPLIKDIHTASRYIQPVAIKSEQTTVNVGKPEIPRPSIVVAQ